MSFSDDFLTENNYNGDKNNLHQQIKKKKKACVRLRK